MKNVTFLFWAIAGIAALAACSTKTQEPTKMESAKKATRKKVVDTHYFSAKLLDSLHRKSSYVVLQICLSECSICSDVRKDSVHSKFAAPVVHFDITASKNNKLLAQALFTSGFPTSYILDRNNNVVGVVEGAANYAPLMEYYLNAKSREAYKKLEVAVKKNSKWLQDTAETQQVVPAFKIMGDVSVRKTNVVLSNSLRALIAQLDGNSKDAYKYALLSRSNGSYFFNSYLLYSYFRSIGRGDSTSFYKRKTLKYNVGVNKHIYDNIIADLSK